MRKLKLLMVAAVMLIFASCSKDSVVKDQTSPDNYLKSASLMGEVFMVYPSGGDDTDELLDAFAKAQLAGDGSVVQLAEGTYITSSIEVRDFCGSFVGAGMDKTIILAAPDLPCKESFDDNNVFSHLFTFIAGNVTIAGMTMKIPDGFACETDYGYGGRDLVTILTLGDYSQVYHPQERYLNAIVKDVRFIGGTDDGSGASGAYNVSCGIWAAGDWWLLLPGSEYPFSRMNVTITGCKFENMLIAMEGSNLGREGFLEFSKNYTHDIPMGFFAGYSYGGKLKLNQNKFINISGISLWLDDDDWGGLPNKELEIRTSYEIKGNIFNIPEGATGIMLRDYMITVYPEIGVEPNLFNIKSNYFSLSEGSTGIYGINTQDAVLTGNIFKGRCTAGIMFEGVPITDWYAVEHPAVWVDNILMLGNNVSNLYSSMGDIVLAEKTMNCTVAGSSGDIVNNGLNNKITGMKPMMKPMMLGPGIRDNFDMLKINHLK